MKKPRLHRITAMLLATVMTFGIFVFAPTGASAAETGTETSKEIAAILNADSYAEYSERFTKQKKGESAIDIDLFDYIVDVNTVKQEDIKKASELPEMEGVEFAEESLYTPDHGKVSWKVNISAEQRGMYGIEIEYYPIADNIATIERILYIDNAVPFSEARTLSFTKVWKYYYEAENGELVYEYYKDENGKPCFKQDKGGNDLRYSIGQKPEWRTYRCSDVDGFVHSPFEFYFSEGEHTITLEGIRESLVIKSIRLFPVEEVPTYEEYIASFPNATAASGGATVIEAETPEAVSDTSIYPTNDRTSPINSPSLPESQLFNVIGGTSGQTASFKTVGQWASYSFTVEETGLYDMVFRFRQSLLEGMFTSRVIKLWSSDGMYGLPDGTPTVPFEEANFMRFDFSKDWQVSPLTDGNQEFKFYFEKGVTYTVYVEVGLGELSQVISTVQKTLSSINNSYLSILRLTGASPDKYRDYGFSDIMPDTIRDLFTSGKTLESVSVLFEELCGTKGAQVATLDKIALLLTRMGSDEDEIASNLENLKSNIGTLGTWLNQAKEQTLVLDYISIQPAGSKLPRKDASVFRSIWFELRAFISSFFVDYNSMGVTEEVDSDTLINVWLAYGRDQALIWRNMVDSQYTPKSGIAVGLKLVAGGALLPSVLSGQGPDVYIGLDAATTINYAIRGAVKDVQDYAGFEEVYGYDIEQTVFDENEQNYIYRDSDGNKVDREKINFNYANTIPISLYGKTYGVPETTNFSMMFYRLDVLADLGINLPKTWDDLLEAVPVLQANNMDIGLSSPSTTMLYQAGGSLWKYEDDPEYAGAQIGLDTDVALDSFRFATRLYTDYSFPVAFDGVNRFRTGEMPLVITDYCTTYNTLTVFATEIKGLWQFTSIPGIVRENGVLNNSAVANLTATVMLPGAEDRGTADAAWDYMKWQAGADVQASYGNQMVALVGPAAKYATANMQALKDLSWTTTEYASLIAQFDNLAAVPNYPGSYIIARYTNFAFLDAVNGSADPVDAIYGYITTINKEITRKREEFDLPTLEIGETPEMARAKKGN